MKKKLLTILALLCLTVSGAWAQEVTLLTTIESTGDNASFIYGSKTFDNIATVAFSGTVVNDDDDWGWWSDSGRTLTVTAAEGYTITRVKFYTRSGSAFDEDAPFDAILVDDDFDGNIAKVNGTSIGACGVTKIEVYGYADTPAEPITVYFTDAQNYGDVNVYYWPNGGDWPGHAMTWVKKNEYNQDVYKAEIPASCTGVIFNGNGRQTVDITENIVDGAWWFSKEGIDGSGHNYVASIDLTFNVTANEGETGEYWSTFYSNNANYQAPAGTQVFKVTLEGTTIALNEVGDGIITEGRGVLLKSTCANYTLTPCKTASTDDYAGNSLVGTMLQITNPGENNYYVLGKRSNGVGFYKLDATGTIAANKAYLTYSGSLAREFFGFGEATSINSIDNLTIDNLTIYDLQGRRVQNPQRGVYIS